MQTALEAKKIQPLSSASEYTAATLVELPDDKADEVMELVASLEEDDDVQNVYTNLA
jgi:transcriptional/translational regulatory protein YebC/TACO1